MYAFDAVKIAQVNSASINSTYAVNTINRLIVKGESFVFVALKAFTFFITPPPYSSDGPNFSSAYLIANVSGIAMTVKMRPKAATLGISCSCPTVCPARMYM